MSNILVLGTGTQGLILVKTLHDSGHKVILMALEKGNYADSSRYVEKCYFCLDKDDSYLLSFLNDIIIKESINAIIPTGDSTADFICKNRKNINSLAKYKFPSYEDFLNGYDKNKLMNLCRQKGYPHPLTIDLSTQSIESDDVKNFPYPGMLKPNCTTGGRGMVEISNYSELLDRYSELHALYGDYHLQKFIKPGGRQIKIQLYIDEKKQLVAHSVQQKLRWYPNRGGSNTCAVSIENNALVNICFQILKDINWLGFADFDAIENPDTGDFLIMEINPRIPACIKGAIVAGVNWGEVIVNGYLDLPQRSYTYRTGVYLRHVGLDFLWFLHAHNRWSVKPSWFHFIGSKTYYQDASSWSDPMPFIKGTLNNIAKLFNPEFKKSKHIK